MVPAGGFMLCYSLNLIRASCHLPMPDCRCRLRNLNFSLFSVYASCQTLITKVSTTKYRKFIAQGLGGSWQMMTCWQKILKMIFLTQY